MCPLYFGHNENCHKSRGKNEWYGLALLFQWQCKNKRMYMKEWLEEIKYLKAQMAQRQAYPYESNVHQRHTHFLPVSILWLSYHWSPAAFRHWTSCRLGTTLWNCRFCRSCLDQLASAPLWICKTFCTAYCKLGSLTRLLSLFYLAWGHIFRENNHKCINTMCSMKE